MTDKFDRIREDEGFTLLELVIAAVVLLIAVAGIFGLLIQATSMSVQAKKQNIALNAASSYMEQIRSMPFAVIGVEGIDASGALPAETTMAVGGFTVTIRPEVDDDPKSGDLLLYACKAVKVTVTVTAAGMIPVVRSVESIIRDPKEQQGGEGFLSLSFAPGHAPSSDTWVQGTSVEVVGNGSNSDPDILLNSAGMYLNTSLLFGDGDIDTDGDRSLAQWTEIERNSKTFTFHWDTTKTDSTLDPGTGTMVERRRYPEGGPWELVFKVFDKSGGFNSIKRFIYIDNEPPGDLPGAPSSTVRTSKSTDLFWPTSMDGNLPADHYLVHTWRERTNSSPAAPWDLSNWIEDDANGDDIKEEISVTTTSCTLATVPFTRYEIRVQPASKYYLAGETEMASPFVSKPGLVVKTYTNTSPANKKWSTKVTLSPTQPQFPTSVVAYRVFKSTDRVTWTEVTPPPTSPAPYTYIYATDGFAPTAYYFKYRIAYTPSGWRGGTSRTIESDVVGPVPASVGSGNLSEVP